MPGEPDDLNQNLEYAGRVADYLEFAELLALDALHRTRIVRRPLPRGEPDARRRGAARRRRTSRTSPPGSSRGVGRAADAAQGTARVREREPDAAELQVGRSWSGSSPIGSQSTADEHHATTLKVWRQAGHDAPGAWSTTSAEHVSPDMSFLEMLDVVNEDADPAGARIRSRSIPTAAKGICGVVRARGQRRGPRARSRARPSASCTCASSGTATRSPSSRGAPRRFPSSRTWSWTAAPSTASSRPAATCR